MERPDPNQIHPEQPGNILYWSRKWGVNPGDLLNAILTTGSLNTLTVKDYLRRDSWLHHPVKGSMRFFRSTVQFLF